MSAGELLQTIGQRLRPLQGVILSLLSAITAEVFFSSFSIALAPLQSVGRVAVVFVLVLLLHRYALTALSSYRAEPKDILFLGIVIVGTVFHIWIGRILCLSLAAYGEKLAAIQHVPPQAYSFAIPFAAGALLLQAILGLHHGLIFSLVATIFVGVYFPEEPLLTLYVLATTIAAVLSLSRFRTRSAYLKAGLNVSLVAVFFSLALIVLEGPMSASEIVVRLSGAILCGAISAFMASGMTPVVEHLGGYVTDLRLIEMATLDHPLLKELSIRAPGTWNHSMVMGMMGEAAAEAIGANPIVTRVGAYFHDIGKMTKPLYFVENQAHDENRHDKLSPSMSALIIRSHVKDGLELGVEHGLPRVIMDMIPQHHGTSRIEYFYEKARREAEESGNDPEQVDANLYSYPGPRPQTREAGILMLADGIEAAARTLNDPSLDRIQGLVQKLINKIFSSGELEESDLTLRDLHLIAKCFTRVLTGIYHQRIAYAEPAEKVNDEQNESASSPATLAPEAPSTEEEASEDKTKKEDLKRLGME